MDLEPPCEKWRTVSASQCEVLATQALRKTKEAGERKIEIL